MDLYRGLERRYGAEDIMYGKVVNAHFPAEGLYGNAALCAEPLSDQGRFRDQSRKTADEKRQVQDSTHFPKIYVIY